jgi:hypothetical protein
MLENNISVVFSVERFCKVSKFFIAIGRQKKKKRGLEEEEEWGPMTQNVYHQELLLLM